MSAAGEGGYRTESTGAAPRPPFAQLHLPPAALGGCIHLAVERDTRGLQLSDAQRFNYYPASPLPVLSWIFEGKLHLVQEPGAPDSAPVLAPALARVVLAGPHRRPTASWSPGGVHALSVALYPDALAQMLGIQAPLLMDQVVPLHTVLAGTLRDQLLAQLLDVAKPDARAPFERVQAVLQPLWQGVHKGQALPTLRGWLQTLAVRAAFSKTGANLRGAQRRFRGWTGQSHRDLQLYARTERAMARAAAQSHASGTAPDLAAVAAEAGFADQSHLGREVRRVTGLSPGRLGELMQTEEAFWFYRLMNEHLRDRGPA